MNESMTLYSEFFPLHQLSLENHEDEDVIYSTPQHTALTLNAQPTQHQSN